MVEQIKKKLSERLEQAQKYLSEKDLKALNLEILSSDIKKAFDSAIVNLSERKDLAAELIKNKLQLRRFKIGLSKTVFPINFKYLFSAFFIYSVFFPTVILHAILEIYHQICFRIYGIPRVDYRDYFIYDRHILPYLNILEKFNCIYCSYFNNFIRYAAEIGARTERFWCPIKYSKRVEGAHSQYEHFVEYLDADSFRTKLKDLRDFSDIEKKETDKQCDFVK